MNSKLDQMIDSLCKASVAHSDSMTFTDVKDHALSKLSTSEDLQNKIKDSVKDLNIGETVKIPLPDNKYLKLYRVEEGLYSGTIMNDEDGSILHEIDKATIPEIANHLSVKGIEEAAEEITEEVNEEKAEEAVVKQENEKNIVININISKSKETTMDSLDRKIGTLIKSKKLKKEEYLKTASEDVDTSDKQEDPVKEAKVATPEDGRKNLISNMIDTLKEHHTAGHADNVKDVSKFLVHLHNNNKDSNIDSSSNGNKSQMMKKSSLDLDVCQELTKAESIKLSDAENKEVFDLCLKELIESAYIRLSHHATEEVDLGKLKEEVNECVVRRMSWDDKFVLAKRAAKYNDKLLDSYISKFNFKKIDKKLDEIKNMEPMYYSEERFKIFAEGNGVSKRVLDTLEKGNNFFGRNIEPQKLGIDFIEKDYESMLKSRPERKVEANIQKALKENIKRN